MIFPPNHIFREPDHILLLKKNYILWFSKLPINFLWELHVFQSLLIHIENTLENKDTSYALNKKYTFDRIWSDILKIASFLSIIILILLRYEVSSNVIRRFPLHGNLPYRHPLVRSLQYQIQNKTDSHAVDNFLWSIFSDDVGLRCFRPFYWQKSQVCLSSHCFLTNIRPGTDWRMIYRSYKQTWSPDSFSAIPYDSYRVK